MIKLGNDGSGTFTSTITSDYDGNGVSNTYCFVGKSKYLGTSTTTSTIATDGSATFGGNVTTSSSVFATGGVQSGAVSTGSAGQAGVKLVNDGSIVTQKSASGTCFEVYNSTSKTINFDSSGSATFAGSMTVSGTGQYTGAQRGGVTNIGNISYPYTANLNSANNWRMTLTGNAQLSDPSNQVTGQHGVFRIVQDGTGGRTLAFGSNWKFPGGTAPTLSTAANAEDLLAYYVAASGTVYAQLIVDLK
jgi:hypothetical protein